MFESQITFDSSFIYAGKVKKFFGGIKCQECRGPQGCCKPVKCNDGCCIPKQKQKRPPGAGCGC